MSEPKIHVTVWNEGRHELQTPEIARLYPNGMHGTIADALSQDAAVEAVTATLDQPDQGLPPAVLDQTDVLVWWGHMAHDAVQDALVDRIQQRVLDGMGLIVLHSGHYSKPFRRLLGTSCAVRWRDVGEKERLWVVQPAHPIVAGLEPCFEIPREEMYGEHFDVPTPDELVLISWFAGGEVFRSGCCFYRGLGRIFYFRPGHESYPTYHDPNVQQVLRNAVRWARFQGNRRVADFYMEQITTPLEPLPA